MNKRLFLTAILLFHLLCLPAIVSGAQPFYDSKSWIVNVAGNASLLTKTGFNEKVNVINIQISIPSNLTNAAPDKSKAQKLADYMMKEGYGKKFINALTYNGTSEEYLKKLALANVQRADEEMGNENIRAVDSDGLETILAEDYLPILENNFFVVSYEVTTSDNKPQKYYIILGVEVSKEEAFDIMSCIGDKERWQKLPEFKINPLAWGKYPDLENPEKFATEISKKVPALAVRGVLLHRAPAKVSFGSSAGLKKGDLISFYSQRQDKNGKSYSKRISRARVGKVWENEAQVNFEAGLAGNRKNGDIAVRTPDSHSRFGLQGTMGTHTWGFDILFDSKTGFTRSGVIHHTLVDLGYTITDHPGRKFVIPDSEYTKEYFSPQYFTLGVGYGISKTIMGFIDIMGYFQVQGDLALRWETKLDDYINETNSDSSIPGAIGLRIPVGVRFSINMGYPFRFFIEGGYAPYIRFKDKEDLFNGGIIIDQTEGYLGAKRGGLFLSAGFMF